MIRRIFSIFPLLVLSINCTAAERSPMINVSENMDQLKGFFSDNKGKPKFVAVLSASCAYCVYGARAIKTVLEENKDRNLRVALVWINRLAGDNDKISTQVSEMFNDPRVSNFRDRNQHFGETLTKLLGRKSGDIDAQEIAWDIYLTYNGSQDWNMEMPTPVDWVHQLGNSSKWAEPHRFRTGESLKPGIEKIVKNIIQFQDLKEKKSMSVNGAEVKMKYIHSRGPEVTQEPPDLKYIGTGTGNVKGAINGKIKWDLFEDQGEKKCDSRFYGQIDTGSNGIIKFEATGVFLPDEKNTSLYHQDAELKFHAENPKLAWVNEKSAKWKGDFDMSTYEHNYTIIFN